MSFKSRVVSCSALAGLLSISCATAPQSGGSKRRGKTMQVRQPFPSQERIAEIGKASVQSPLNVVGTMAAVTSWSIEPAVPNHDWTQPYDGDDPNASAYAAWVRAKAPKATASASMTCLAQQYARFQAEQPNAIAGADVLAFMHARCGVPVMDVKPYVWSFGPGKFRPLDPAKPEPTVMKALEGVSGKALTGLGVWQTEERTTLVVLLTEPSVMLQPLPFDTGGEGKVSLTGVYEQPTEWMQASVTHGPLGAKACDRVPVSGPQGAFGFQCPTNPDDAMAVIELAAAPKGSLLGRTVARTLISPNGESPTLYQPPAVTVPATAGDFSPPAVLAGINALRGQAGLDDATSTPPQDGVTANLFPHMIANTDLEVRNEAALGLIAGWQLEDTIRVGSFETVFNHTDTPLDRTLAAALFSPGFRMVALGADTKVLSTATLSEADTRGLIAVAFEVFEAGDFSREESAVFDALDDARAKVGLAPVTRVEGGKDESALAASAERIRLGESTPGDELDRMLAYFRDTVNRDFYGVIYSPTFIDGWTPDFEDEFFKHDNLAAAITVSYFTPPGAAWGQHVVFVVFTPL